jgi:predicted transcriptional regulator
MDAVKQMRKDVKKYIDTADGKVVKMMHAMLEVDAEADWWDEMPDNVKADVEEAIRQADRGETIPHDEVKKKYSKWFTR